MTHHTPGPWEWEVHVDRDTTGETYCIYGDYASGPHICNIEIGPDQNANAKLIAAAPDMLKALQMVRDALNGAAGPDGNRIVLESSEVAYAIAKATT